MCLIWQCGGHNSREYERRQQFMKTKKRLLSILLSIVMVLGLMPGMSMMAFADEEWKSWSDANLQNGKYTITVAGNKLGYEDGHNTYTLYYDGTHKTIWQLTGISNITGDTDGTYYMIGKVSNPYERLDAQGWIPSNTDQGIEVANWDNGVVDDIGASCVFRISEDGYIYLRYLNPARNVNTEVCYAVYYSNNRLVLRPYNGEDGLAVLNFTRKVEGISLDKESATLNVGGQEMLTATVVPDNATDKTMVWTVGGTNAGAVKLYTDSTCSTEVGTGATSTRTVYAKGFSAGEATVTVTTNDGNIVANCNVTVNKADQTITAENVVATYGDTDKNVSASVTDPATGGGAISYAVKDGSADYIDVDASTGALTIKKVPADGKAYVIVTAAETSTYAQATKEVTVTINKANAVAATVTANNRTYDGTEKPLVTVTGTLTGGTMYYALGENAAAAPADNLYTTSIPTATGAGTYYVWYKVFGDENHLDSEPACIKVVVQSGEYAVLKVDNADHTIGSGQNAVITVKRSTGDDRTFSLYAGAAMDGTPIASGNCDTAPGSLILTLKSFYLDSLSVGDHKLTISFQDGSADTTVKILPAASVPTPTPKPVPKTGDSANPALWLAMMLVALIGFAGLAVTGTMKASRKKK